MKTKNVFIGSTGAFPMRQLFRHFCLVAVPILFLLPFTAVANDTPTAHGYCGPKPPNAWFEFSSKTVPEIKAQLIATLTARAHAEYPAGVAKWMAYNGGETYQGMSCIGRLNASAPFPPIIYCTDLSDCRVILYGEVWSSCGGQESSRTTNGFVDLRGNCEITYNTAPKKVVVIDPGHGLNCGAVGQAAGSIGVTDFPANDPPSGRLREDYLTLAIAKEAQRLLSSKYAVKLTKAGVNSCPTFKERGRIANNANAKVFVSIHINAPNVFLGVEVPFGNGTSAIYSPTKPETEALAGQLATAVSTNLGTNNRGAVADSRGLAVLKPTVTNMPAVLLEAARLSGSDEKKLHTAGSATKVASGIQTVVQAFVGN